MRPAPSARPWPKVAAPVVFENRSGAGSTIGTSRRQSAPDGYTLVMGIPAGITIAPHIYPKLGYGLLTDLVPIAGFATSPAGARWCPL